MRFNYYKLILFILVFTQTCSADNILSVKDIDIQLSSTKSSGKGWDAFRNAPDIALCIVTELDDHCYLQVGPKKDSHKIHNPLFQKRKYSLCQNSYDCKFEVNTPLNEIMGLIVLDLDAKNNDFVDAAIIIPKAENAESKTIDKIKKMDERLRNISYKYSQVFSEAEKQRRLKKFTVCKVSKRNSSKCKLRQSRIEIN